MPSKPTYEELAKRIEILEAAASAPIGGDPGVVNNIDNLRAILDVSPYPIAVVDLQDDRITLWSRSALELFGHTAPTSAEWYQMAYPDPDYRRDVIERWKPHLEVARQSGRAVSTGEYRVACKDGSERICELHAAFLPDHLIVTFYDITDRKRAEQDLSDRESFLRRIIDQSPFAMWISDPDGTLQQANPTLRRFLNVTDEQIVGKYNVLHDPVIERQGLIPLIRTVYEESKTVNFECEWEGTDFPIHNLEGANSVSIAATMFPILDKNDVLTHVVLSWIDITARNQAEKSLRRSRQKYQSIVEGIGIGVALISPQMEVVELNRQMRQWFPSVDPENTPVCFHAFNDPPSETHCDYCPTIKTLKDGQVHEATTSTPSGTGYRNFRVVSSPIHDDAGKVVAAIEMVEDITERQKLESQLQQSQKLESIGNLAGGIAHDFNNVLASIIGFTELALDDVETGSAAESSLHEVYSAGKRARDLVRRILTFARRTEEETKPLQVKTILKEVLQFLRSSIPTTVEIKTRLESNSYIMGNATQVHQVIMNLCTNAADAMEDGGGILEVKLRDITISPDNSRVGSNLEYGEYIEMVISDSGMGIDPDVIGLIFEPYFTTKGPGQGTGMGLAVVHGIVESYGGEIIVRNRQGNGAEFIVYLPITMKDAAPVDLSIEDVLRGTERILLVDDEVSITRMNHHSLSRLGYHVTTRTSSVEALELFRARPRDFDLVITDMTMPNMTGDQMAVEMMKIRPDIPVVLCTGYNRRMSEERALNLGIKAFAFKPFVIADLAKIIRKVLADTEGSQ